MLNNIWIGVALNLGAMWTKLTRTSFLTDVLDQKKPLTSDRKSA